MAEGTCSVAGCDRATRSKGMCNAHYRRWRTTGDPGSAAIQLRGADRGCVIEGCERRHFGHGYCQTHAYRLRENGDPLVTRPPGTPSGPNHPSARGDDIEYAALHRRLKSWRGKASDYPCCACGMAADNWAYQHTSADERICPKVGLPYSTNIDDYLPMCHSCHTRFDNGLLQNDWRTRK